MRKDEGGRMKAESVRRFKPYPAYKDSGVEWLGEIPAHWEVKKWRYCCSVTEGQVAPDDDRYRARVMIAPNHHRGGDGSDSVHRDRRRTGRNERQVLGEAR